MLHVFHWKLYLQVKVCRSVQSVVELVGELLVFPAISFIHHLSHSAHAALVEDFFLQPGTRRVGALLQVTEVGVLLFLAFSFLSWCPVRAQVLSGGSLDLSHQLWIEPVWWLLLSPPPLLLLLPQSVLLLAGSTHFVSRDDATMERTLHSVLPRTQLPIPQRRSAGMADWSEAAGEGDVSGLTLSQQLLVLHLLLHLRGNPELVLRSGFDNLSSVGLLLTPVVQIHTKRNYWSINGLLV